MQVWIDREVAGGRDCRVEWEKEEMGWVRVEKRKRGREEEEEGGEIKGKKSKEEM